MIWWVVLILAGAVLLSTAADFYRERRPRRIADPTIPRFLGGLVNLCADGSRFSLRHRATKKQIAFIRASDPEEPTLRVEVSSNNPSVLDRSTPLLEQQAHQIVGSNALLLIGRDSCLPERCIELASRFFEVEGVSPSDSLTIRYSGRVDTDRANTRSLRHFNEAADMHPEPLIQSLAASLARRIRREP